MITEIYISGQINGNFILARAISCNEKRSGMFNSFTLIFDTRKEAKKALWEAYKRLREEEPEFKRGIRYSAGASLYYDASVATIL